LLSGTESYLGQRNGIDVSAVLQDLFSFVILYNYIIPISLYVTIGECQLTIFELEVHKKTKIMLVVLFYLGIVDSFLIDSKISIWSVNVCLCLYICYMNF
jgi:Ca2+/Na+ antiporter